MQIDELLFKVQNLQVVLPEFQREYVWSKDDAKQLMVSLFKRYPTGALLFWGANSEDLPDIKNCAVKPEKSGTTDVILDGQQRITTLYLLIKDEIPPYYTDTDIVNDPRHLYFNLETSEFKYYKPSEMEDNPIWQNVPKCFKATDEGHEIDSLKIYDDTCKKHPDKAGEELRRKINDNLNRLRYITNIDYPILQVKADAKIDDAIDVFDRINSQGTKLTDSELVLTHIVGKWPHARRDIKAKIEQLKKVHYNFDLGFFTRCMVIDMTDSALFIKNAKLDFSVFTQDDYKNTWKRVSQTVDYLIPILKKEGFFDSTDDMSSTNPIVPIIAYLLKNEIQMSQPVKYGFMYWLHLALIWSRYSGQTDARLDKDVNIVLTSEDPINDLVIQIKDQCGRIEVTPSELEGRDAGHPLYKALYSATKYYGAIDWDDGSPVGYQIGDIYRIESHHIFPQSILYKNGYDGNNHLHKKIVNEIANRAFITHNTNFKILNKFPSEYLPEILKKYPDALEKQFIPNNPNLWKIENYELFLIERRKIIANSINQFLTELKNKGNHSPKEKISYEDLIKKGENDYIEFKSSLRWDYQSPGDLKKSEYIVMKVINSFLNSNGGKLFIGVADNGTILGLYKDYKTFNPKNMKQDSDGFKLHLDNLIRNYLGNIYHTYITVNIEKVKSMEICIIDVEPSNQPVFLTTMDNNGNKKEEFLIRRAASSVILGNKETTDYISHHWQ